MADRAPAPDTPELRERWGSFAWTAENADKAKEMQTRFGAALRALAGNSARNQAAAPAAKPAKPAKPVKPAPQPTVEQVLAVAEQDEETPF